MQEQLSGSFSELLTIAAIHKKLHEFKKKSRKISQGMKEALMTNHQNQIAIHQSPKCTKERNLSIDF
jgi:hypothetical protein